MEPTFDDLINRLLNLPSKTDEESLPDEDQIVIYALRNHLGRDPIIEDFKKCIRYPHPGLPAGDYCLVYNVEKLGIVHFKENGGVMLITFDDPEKNPQNLSWETKPHSIEWFKFPSPNLN